MKIEVDVPIENIYNVLESPHIRYWANNYAWTDGSDIGYVVDWFEEVGYELHSANLRSGLEIMAKNNPTAFSRLVAGTQDGVTGDLLVQYMAFGELKYG